MTKYSKMLANGTRSSLDNKAIPWITASKSSNQKLKFEFRPIRKQYFEIVLNFYATTLQEKETFYSGTSLRTN